MFFFPGTASIVKPSERIQLAVLAQSCAGEIPEIVTVPLQRDEKIKALWVTDLSPGTASEPARLFFVNV